MALHLQEQVAMGMSTTRKNSPYKRLAELFFILLPLLILPSLSDRWTHSFTLITLAASLFCSVFIMLSGGSRFSDENHLHIIYLVYETVCFASFFIILVGIAYFGYRNYSLQIEANQLRQQIYSKWLLDRAIALQKLNREVNEDEEAMKVAKEKKKKQDEANPMHQKTVEEEEKFENANGATPK